jgi:hypothetical protein
MQAKYGICLTKSSYILTKINTDQLQRVDLNKYNINTSKWKLFFLKSHYKNRAMDTKWRNFDCLSRCNQMVK